MGVAILRYDQMPKTPFVIISLSDDLTNLHGNFYNAQ